MFALGLTIPLLAGVGLRDASRDAGGGSTKPAEASQSSEPRSVADVEIADFRRELLDFAFRTASAIPVDPHIKDRSRSQEEVVLACLTLDQPELARRYCARIMNWRRGTALAEHALYCAKRSDRDEAKRSLNLAEQAAARAEGWRRDRIRVAMARSYTLLGETGRATDLERDVESAEVGKVDQIRAMQTDGRTFIDHIKAIDALVATNNFDIIRNALGAYTELYGRFYQDADRRTHVKSRIEAAWTNMPIMVRIETLMDLARSALDHADTSNALAIVNEADGMLEGAEWLPRHEVPLKGRLAALRAEAGDRDGAKKRADAALALYRGDLRRIVNIDRADALRPSAAAYFAMGDPTRAIEIYKLAVEAGVENPNSRPRAQDLASTCVSLAVHGVEPDEALWARIREIGGGLDHPW